MDNRRKKILLSLLYVFLILLGIAALFLIWPNYRQYRQKQVEVFEAREKVAALGRARAKLKQDVIDLESKPGAVEKVAREKFGLCEPGETVITYNPPPDKAAKKYGSVEKNSPPPVVKPQ